MRILIIGGKGTVGSSVAEHFQKHTTDNDAKFQLSFFLEEAASHTVAQFVSPTRSCIKQNCFEKSLNRFLIS